MDDSVKGETPGELPQTVINGIKTLVFFVGHTHSGHSIVDSLVIRHEYDLFTKLVS